MDPESLQEWYDNYKLESQIDELKDPFNICIMCCVFLPLIFISILCPICLVCTIPISILICIIYLCSIFECY